MVTESVKDNISEKPGLKKNATLYEGGDFWSIGVL
jgi:hypothetical protein